MLTGVKNLAKISSTPGKTQLINHFLVNDNWYLVDLPGYGYARASKSSIGHFNELIKGYIVTRPNLLCLFVLIDSRLEPQKNDTGFITFLGQLKVPFVIVFTKTDKISSGQLQKNIHGFKKALLQTWETLPEIFISSVVNKSGKKEILSFIERAIQSFKK